MTGKIIKGIAGFYYVDTGEAGIYECKAKGLFRREGQKPLVGDDVRMEVTHEGDREGNITELLPRKSELIRPAVANVDQALVLFALEDPKPNLGLLDRFLVMMEQQGLPAAVCFNKADLADREYEDRLRGIYAGCGCPIFFCCARERTGIREVAEYLAHRTTVLAGPSGVGKSTMTNLFSEEVRMETGEISRKLGRGRHTTRHSQLIRIGADTFLFDTPGFSSLYLGEFAKEDLKNCFPEFAPYEGACRYPGCVHVKEPGCAVREALAAGRISRERYEHYVQFYEEQKEQEKRRY